VLQHGQNVNWMWIHAKKNAFALTVDASTGYISLPNHNKHEEIDGKNTQIMLALTVL